jgi:hypothetical protein
MEAFGVAVGAVTLFKESYLLMKVIKRMAKTLQHADHEIEGALALLQLEMMRYEDLHGP